MATPIGTAVAARQAASGYALRALPHRKTYTTSWDINRREAAQAWCEIAKALASSPEVEDRKLAQSIVQYARHLSGVRYKPPEQQAQRELPSMEWGRDRTRDVERTAPTRTVQRDLDIER